MKNSEPNYRMYSVDQLNDALEKIDREKHPGRVANIEWYLKNPGPKGYITKDKRISVSENTESLFAFLSAELVFWLISIALGIFGFYVW